MGFDEWSCHETDHKQGEGRSGHRKRGGRCHGPRVQSGVIRRRPAQRQGLLPLADLDLRGARPLHALYSPWGQNPEVKWLSTDGTRENGVQVTVVSGDIYLTLDGQTFHSVGPKNPPVREGQAQHSCSIYGVSEDGRDSITGTAIVAVIPRES